MSDDVQLHKFEGKQYALAKDVQPYFAELAKARKRIDALEKALIEMRNTVYLHPVRIGDSKAEMDAFALTTRALLEISKKMKVVLADASVKSID